MLRRNTPTPRLSHTTTPEAAVFAGTRALTGATALLWDLPDLCTIALVYPSALPQKETWAAWVEELPFCRAVVAQIGTNEPLGNGPGLQVRDTDPRVDCDHYELWWSKLADLLGGPVPYWPTALRVPAALEGWRPGAPPRPVAALPSLDLTPALRVAARTDADDPMHATVLHFAREVLADAYDSATRQAEMMHADPALIAFPAFPVEVTAPGELDPAVERAGWLQLLDLADPDAEAVVDAVYMVDGGARFPASALATLGGDNACMAEWTGRLEPVERSAWFALVTDDRATTTYVDPATALPVAHDPLADQWHTLLPSRLPSPAPLREVILHSEQVWIRCEDGTLYPCPGVLEFSASWGYAGSGPDQMARILAVLLDDINAAVTDALPPVLTTLVQLCEFPWAEGTVLDRARLLRAQQGMQEI